MSDLVFRAVGAGESEIGPLVSQCDLAEVYLAIPMDYYPNPLIGLFVEHARFACWVLDAGAP